jgi:glutamate-1-semialdehyde 2,1-aminomutase
MGWGASILGHNHPAVVAAVRKMLTAGALVGLTHPLEITLAKLIVEAVPSVEQIRLTVSGTEACLTAVKLARGATKRQKILTFKGCYHGHGESLMAGISAGIPDALGREVLCIPFNDIAALETAMKTHGHEVACAIIEPVAANMGVVVPERQFLERLRALTRESGALLIFDEVVTGFRLGSAGAQGLFQITPDLTTFGKIIGGGLPIGAVGGPARLMKHLAPEGAVYHGGTFAGHPLSMAAGVATLRWLRTHPPYAQLERDAAFVEQELARAATAAGVPVHINRAGSMFTVFFSERDRFAQWAQGLRRRGILIPPSPFEALFISTAHRRPQLERLIGASRQIFREVA